jgi:hypothetical protein
VTDWSCMGDWSSCGSNCSHLGDWSLLMAFFLTATVYAKCANSLFGSRCRANCPQLVRRDSDWRSEMSGAALQQMLRRATKTEDVLLIIADHFQEAISCSSQFWLSRFKGSQSLPLRGDHYRRHF